MDAYKKALWFGWTREALQPPRMPAFMRERREREATAGNNKSHSHKPQRKSGG